MHANALDAVDNEIGYTVMDIPNAVGPAREVLRHHLRDRMPEFLGVDQRSFELLAGDPIIFERFRNKESRIFSPERSLELKSIFVRDLPYLAAPGVYISDEESLGYENIYFRCVRPNHESDVGEPHADKWFWDLGLGRMPAKHRRVKVWLPLQLDDTASSFLAIPGSHRKRYRYGSKLGSDGKRRPIFLDDAARQLLTAISVRVGQAIVFHDELIHAGRATNRLRLSMEFTMIVPEMHK